MDKQFIRLALASAMALSMVTSGIARADDNASQEIVDARQQADISTSLAQSPYLRANDFTVSAHLGKVTLTGNVAEEVNKDLAKQIALAVNGVKEVDNQIVVSSDYMAPVIPAERGNGEAVDDATIAAEIKFNLLSSAHSDSLKTEVESNLGRVTLSGSADNEADRNHATRLAWNTRGVVSVDNRLLVDDEGPSTSVNVNTDVREAGNGIADRWITTKIKSTFMYSRKVDGSGITVNTHAGVVSLSGRVSSDSERALAVELADNVRGVKHVNFAGLSIGSDDISLVQGR